jgi:hypothetical protein
VIHTVGFTADLLSNASFFALLAAALSGGEPSLVALYAGVALYKGVKDARMIGKLRGTPLPLRYALALPLRDLILPGVWLHALFSRTTEWRGERFRLGRGSRLTPLSRAAEPVVSDLHDRQI